jgi:SNF2 family DNA or RNA helicase
MLIAEIDPDLPTKVKLDGPFKYNDLIGKIPGTLFKAPRSADRSKKLEQAWRAPLPWQRCLALRTTFGDELEIGPSLRAWAAEYRKTYVEPAMLLRTSTSAEIPGFEELFDYQKAGVKFMATTKRALLTDGMGAGKTRQAISTLRYLEEQGDEVFPSLIVAPNSTLLSWKREIELVWPGKKINVIKGSAGVRRKLLDDAADFYIINWEGLKAHSRVGPYGDKALKRCVEHGGEDPNVKPTQCQAHPKELNAIDFKSAIGDEIHRAISGAAVQTRALKAATADVPIKLALSGTPISNNPSDLWSPLNWILPESYPGRTAFIERFMELSFNAWGGQEVIGLKAHMETEFYAGVDPHLRHMPKDLVLSYLPPIVYERRDVEMSGKQGKAYKQMAKQMLAELDDDLLITTSPLTQSLRLLQLASTYGEVHLEDAVDPQTGDQIQRQKLVLTDPSCKLDAFMDDLGDFGEESVVVFAVSRQLIELLSARLTKAKIKHGLITGAIPTDERQQHMDDFQAGKTKLILVTTAAGGTGITLTAGSIAVFLQRPWSMIESQQAEARVHRIGSEIHDVIRIIDYVTEDTLEETVFPALEKKNAHLEKILRSKDALRKMLEGGELELPEDDE